MERQSLRECKHTSYSDKKKKNVKTWFLKDKANFSSNIIFIKSVPDKEINAPKKSSLMMESGMESTHVNYFWHICKFTVGLQRRWAPVTRARTVHKHIFSTPLHNPSDSVLMSSLLVCCLIWWFSITFNTVVTEGCSKNMTTHRFKKH